MDAFVRASLVNCHCADTRKADDATARNLRRSDQDRISSSRSVELTGATQWIGHGGRLVLSSYPLFKRQVSTYKLARTGGHETIREAGTGGLVGRGAELWTGGLQQRSTIVVPGHEPVDWNRCPSTGSASRGPSSECSELNGGYVQFLVNCGRESYV